MKSRHAAIALMASTAAILIFCGTARADFASGWQAYQKGDFAAALSAWRPMADAGDARSEFNLGNMYDQGRGVGVARDMVAALIWASRAADQGLDRARDYRQKLIDKMAPAEIAKAEQRLRQ